MGKQPQTVGDVLHKAHVAYQKSQLKAEDATQYVPQVRDVRNTGIRGTHVERAPTAASLTADMIRMAGWFTGLRPNFWLAFLEASLEYDGMSRRAARKTAKDIYKFIKSDKGDPKI